MLVNIKYCGGCNPRYDRRKFADKIMQTFPEYQYCFNGTGESDILIILYGCKTACADISNCFGVFGRFPITSDSQWEELCQGLNKLKR